MGIKIDGNKKNVTENHSRQSQTEHTCGVSNWFYIKGHKNKKTYLYVEFNGVYN